MGIKSLIRSTLYGTLEQGDDMGTDLERHDPHGVAPLRVTPEDAAKFARAFAAAKLFSAGYDDANADQIFAQIMVGAEYGFGPGASMINLYLMPGGRIELSANAQAAFIKQSGKYDYRVTELTDTVCEITVIAVPTGEVIGVERYTWADAERQELTNLTKRGQKTNWHKTPRNMLFARCISNVCAFHCPDAVPMRTYAPGEVSGHEGENRPEVSAATMQAIEAIEARVAEGREEVAVETVADDEVETVVEVVERGVATGMVTDVRTGMVYVVEHSGDFDPATEPPPKVVEVPSTPVPVDSEKPDERFSASAIETRLREDLPKLNTDDKAEIKSLVTDTFGMSWSYGNLVKCIIDAGFSDVRAWLAFKRTMLSEPQEGSSDTIHPGGDEQPHPGVTGRQTGSQTAPVVSDNQVKMLHARFSECGFSEAEKRHFLRTYAQCESTRQVKAADVDDLLAVLNDIRTGTPTTRQAYLGGAQ